MRKKLYFSLLIFNLGFGQNIPTYPNIPNPEVSSIGKYIDNPVNLSNGQTPIVIDLILLNDVDFRVPITLNYNTSGVRVSEIASRVGLGWSINTGGFIARTSRGIPDDSPNGYLNGMKIENFLNSSISQKSGILQSEGNDFESDIYSYSFFGISGTFYFDQNGNIHSHPKTDILIEPQFLNNVIIGWIVTNVDGTKYYMGLSKDKSRSANDLTSSAGTSNTGSGWSLLDFPSPHINTWHLADVETKNNNLISYEYESSDISYWNLIGQERYIQNGNSLGDLLGKVQTSYLKNEDKTHRVKKIVSRLGSVEFYYDLIREDLIGDYALSKVILKKGDVIIDSYKLNYFYHFSSDIYKNPINFENYNQRAKRLMLQSVQQNINNVKNKEYFFEYYTDRGFPERLSFSQDHWGYFNGKINSFFFPKVLLSGSNLSLIETDGGDKKVNENFSSALSIKKITYPTGGYLLFDFESNKTFNLDPKPWIVKYEDETVFQYNSQFLNGTEERILSLSNFDQTREYLSWEVDFNSQCDNSRSFNCPFAQFYILVDGSYKLVSESRGVNINKNFNIPNSNNNVNLKIVLYNYSQDFNGSGRNDFSIRIIRSKATSLNQILVGGIRTKELKHFNFDGQLISSKKVNYNFFDQTTVSSGHSLYTPLFLIDDYPITNGSAYLIKSNSLFPLNNNGSSVLYTEVEEINQSIDIGKTEYFYSFTKDGIGMTDFQLWKFVMNNSTQVNVGELPGFKNLLETETPRESYSNRRGLLLKTNTYTYNKSLNIFNKVSEEINVYDFSFKNTNILRLKNILVKKVQGHFGYSVYDNFLENTRLLGNIKTEFFNSNEVKIIKDYKYDDFNYYSLLNLKEEIKTDSDGEKTKTIYSYAYDLNNQAMIAKNMIGIPLKTEIYKNNEKLSTTETKYKDWGNNLLAPEVIITAKGNLPVEDRIKYTIVDNTNGNPIEIEQVGGVKIVYLWGYNKTQPVAKIENIAYNAIPTSRIQAIESASNEANLMIALTALRNDVALSNAMVTTYTYKPLVGISSVTDPRGDKQTYHYDSFNRLQFVKDAQGNILSENQYHYRTQN